MAGDPDHDPVFSGAWYTDPAGDAPRAMPDRYRVQGVIGVGGTARVRRGLDRQLGREVAIKRSSGATDALALAREARLTALLEHQGVPAVYDLGEDADGPWFVMRLVRGRTLRAVLGAQRTDPVELVGWLRDACDVVAYAHERGVVHRDLKPDNVIVGEHGEVVVLDWGLAAPAGTPTAESIGSSVSGTPGYMSGEQWDGEPPAPSQDVWSLGAMLYEVLAGHPPFCPADRGRLAHRVRSEPVPQPTGPPELVSIAAKALARGLGQRYPDAAGLSADLTRWLHGRQIAHHRYSAWQVVKRALWARRGALAATAAVLLAGAAVAGVGLARLVEAERASSAASVEAREQQRRLLSLLAQQAADGGDRARAEQLAVEALALGPSPIARGVLARYGAEGRPRLLDVLPLPGCRGPATRTGDGWVCVQDARSAQAILRGVGPGSEPWELPLGKQQLDAASEAPVAFLREGQAGVSLDPRTGRIVRRFNRLGWKPQASVAADGARVLLAGRQAGRLELDAGAFVPWQPCEDVVRVLAAPDADVAFCADSVHTRQGGDTTAADLPVPLDLTLVRPLGTDVIAVHDGTQLVRIDPRRGRVTPLATLPSRARALAAHGERVLVSMHARPTELRDAGSGRVLMAFPHTSATGLRLTGDHVDLVDDGRRFRYAHESAHPPRRFRAGRGIFPATRSPDGAWIAAGSVDGGVYVWSADGGRAERLELTPDRQVPKWVSFSPDGRQLGVSLLGVASSRRIEVGSWADRGPLWPAAGSVRRFAWLEDAVLAAHYARRLEGISDAGEPLPGLSTAQSIRRVAVLADRSEALLLTQDGIVLRATASPPGLTQVGTHGDASELAVAPDGSRWGLAGPLGAVVFAEGQERRFALPERAVSLAMTAELLFAGYEDGRIEAYDDDGRLVGVLHGHRDVVRSLEVDAASAELLSGSWDGTARLWRLASLTESVADLARRIAEAYPSTSGSTGPAP